MVEGGCYLWEVPDETEEDGVETTDGRVMLSAEALLKGEAKG